jgi:MFS family permease
MHASAGSIGVILAVGGIGHIFGSFIGPMIQKRYSYKYIIITLTWMYLIWWSLYLVSYTPLLLGITTAVLSMNRPIQNIANSNCRMMLVPDEMRGRVNSVNQLISWSAIPLGGLVTGTLLQILGPTNTIAFFSLCFLVLGILTTLNPQVRHAPSWAELRRIHDLANAAEKMHSLSGFEPASEHTWVGIDRYLIKLPGRDTGTHEVYAFQSPQRVEEYTRKGTWTTGVESYKVSLPDRYSDTQEVFIYQAAPAANGGPITGGEWSDIEQYKVRLPDRYKDLHEGQSLRSPISLVF